MAGEKKILVAEDEAPLRKAVAKKLSKAGFEVLQAANGEEALEEALSSHPDLILLDVMMPKMDGIQVIEKLKDNKWGKDAQIILLTNVSDPIKVAEATEVGSQNMSIYDYMIKSDWKLEEVVEKVKAKLKME